MSLMNGDGASDGKVLRTPPQHLEAERGVIGSVLLDCSVLPEVAIEVAPEDFFRDGHRILFAGILECSESGGPVDALILAEHLERQGTYATAGGDEALSEIVGSVPHAAHALTYARIVRQTATARRVVEAAEETLRECYAGALKADELLAAAEGRFLAISESRLSASAATADETIEESVGQIVARREPTGHGVMSGLGELDDITGGFQPGQLIIVAARPSIGKSALAQGILTTAAADQGIASLLVSLEMSRAEVGERLLAARSGLDGHLLKHPRLMRADDNRRLFDASEDLRTFPFWVDDSPSRTLTQIAAVARRLKRQHGLGLAVIDYIQLIDAQPRKGESRQEQVARISHRLKGIARELSIPVIALAQLNRQSEQREDRRPRLSDLRESGQIEADADLVILLHRPELADPNDRPGEADAIVAKNRNGPVGTARLRFVKHCTRFEPLAECVPPADQPAF